MSAQTVELSVNPSNETLGFGPITVRFLVAADQSTGSVAAFELVVRGGQRLPAPAHSHDHYEETIYGLEGALTWTVDGKPIEVGPGQALCIRRGAIHRFDNHGSQDAKALCVITPGGHRTRVFPRGIRGAQGRSGRASGSGEDGRSHAPPRAYPRTVTARL